MKVGDVHYRTIWPGADGCSVDVIDQTLLPHRFQIRNLRTLDDACVAIRDMAVRGAPLIGATAAYGFWLAMQRSADDAAMVAAREAALATRPTAVNLRWALDRVYGALETLAPAERPDAALALATDIADEDAANCHDIGRHGLDLITTLHRQKGGDGPVNILTHCNAGWLATVDWGTATSPIYQAHDAGIPLHVWVDETRPRNQGAGLTAWELAGHGVPHTVIVDNAGGHLMQQGKVDLCLVGTDRTTRGGDVCNKIGTYLKALAARDNGVPFYVCLPGSTIDWTLVEGGDIPIEERDPGEVTMVSGADERGALTRVRVMPPQSPAANPAFDVTPARLVSGYITERGVVAAGREALEGAFPDLAAG